MKNKTIKTFAGCLLGVLLFGSQSALAQIVPPDENGFMIASPEDQKPKEGAGSSVTLFGDPSKEGLYAIQITFAPGRGSRPHFHSTARYITVMKGTWWVASGPDGAVYNPDNMQPVTAGTFIYQPPGGHHYDMAKDEEVVVRIMGMGPVVTTQLENN